MRGDAPPCIHCGGHAHNTPDECPRKQQVEMQQEEDEFRQSTQEGKMYYANLKAKMQLGANLDGEYLPNNFLPFSEMGNELRRLRREEERREREELKLTRLHFERNKHAVAKATIEAAEAEMAQGSRHLANLKPGEELSQRQVENITKHGDTVFQQHYQNLTKSGNIPKKEIALEDCGFGAGVTFSGDATGLDIREFFAKFETAKGERNWDEGACATVIAQRLRGPAKIWYDNFRLDPKTQFKSLFYAELKAALMQRFERKRDWFDKNRLFRDVRWDNYRYKGSVLSFWEDIKTRSCLYTEDWDEKKTFTPEQLRRCIASQHFFNTAPNEMLMHLMEKGVEDDPDAMERELKKQEVLIASKHKNAYSRKSGYGYKGDRLRVSAIENDEEDDRTVLEAYWDERAEDQPSEKAVEVDALRKRDPDGSNNGEDTKTCWHCNRPGHVKQNCPELRDRPLDKDRPRRPGDDGKFKHQDVPGFENEGTRRNWVGPPRAAAVGRSGGSQSRTSRANRSRYTRITRSRGSKKPTPIRRNRTYRSRRTRNTYKVAALGGFFTGEDDETIGRVERILVAGDSGEDVEEEDEDDLQPIYDHNEVASLSKISENQPQEEADPPEVAGMEEAPPVTLAETETGYLFGTRGSGDTGERFVPFRY